MKYDLMNVTLVHLSNDKSKNKDVLCGMLEALLSNSLTKSEKIRKLVDEYEIQDTIEFDKEVQIMCDYSIGLAKEYAEKGLKEGLEKGRTEGLEKGRTEGQNALVEAIKRIHAGESVQDLIDSGVDEQTANLAYSCR